MHKTFIEEKKKFLTKFWYGKNINRPLYVIPDFLQAEPARLPSSHQDNQDSPENFLNTQLESLSRRVIGKDDYIPCLSTNIGSYIWAEAFGCEVVKLDDGRKFVKEPIIKEPSDVYKLEKPAISDGSLGFILKVTEYFEKNQSGIYPIMVTDIQTPLTVGPLIWETNNFFLSLYENKKEVHYLFQMVIDLIIEFVKLQESIISDFNPVCWPPIWMPEELGIYCSDDTMPMVSKDIYEQFALPYINQLSDAFGGVFLHSCQIKEEHLESMLKIKNLRGINFDLSGSTEFSKIVDFFQDKVAIAPHNYLREGVPFNDEADYVKYILDMVTDKTRLYFYVCSVMQDGTTSQDRPIKPEKIYQLLKGRNIINA
jgi:hypothetical protein